MVYFLICHFSPLGLSGTTLEYVRTGSKYANEVKSQNTNKTFTNSSGRNSQKSSMS
nr:MAG TPA: hypothetical protein [Caudoviricetes sp.]